MVGLQRRHSAHQAAPQRQRAGAPRRLLPDTARIKPPADDEGKAPPPAAEKEGGHDDHRSYGDCWGRQWGCQAAAPRSTITETTRIVAWTRPPLELSVLIIAHYAGQMTWPHCITDVSAEGGLSPVALSSAEAAAPSLLWLCSPGASLPACPGPGK